MDPLIYVFTATAYVFTVKREAARRAWSERTSKLLRSRVRSESRCLSIVKIKRHHVVLEQPLVCSDDTHTPHRTRKTVTTSTGVCVDEDASGRLRACVRSVCGCLGIGKLRCHHAVVGRPLIRSDDTHTPHRIRKTVTPSAASRRSECLR